MIEKRIVRKLVSILSADMVGYSRLMAADEEGTLSALKTIRSDVLEPTAADFHGQVVKLMMFHP